jgi:hypothetical protein
MLGAVSPDCGHAVAAATNTESVRSILNIKVILGGTPPDVNGQAAELGTASGVPGHRGSPRKKAG